MPTTNLALFSGVDQSNNGGSTVQWANLANVLAEAGQANAFYNAGFPTWFMVLDTPDFTAPVPVDAIISNIKIQIQASMDGNVGTTDVWLESVAIAGGLEKDTSGDHLGNTPTAYEFTGDLAYWGITNQQALDFAAGTETLQFAGSEPFGSLSFNTDVDWVKVEISYTSILIAVPTLF